jgi:lambda family phage portal protein
MWLDNVIGFLSPQRGLIRERARKAIILMRTYDGAKTGRRTDGWVTAGSSANAEIGPAASRLRNNARDLVRNNPYASKAKEVYVTNAISTGIKPAAKSEKDTLNEKIMAAWDKWATHCDHEGQHNFYALQALIAGARYESGECFIRFIDTKANDQGIVPFKLQLLEADFLNTGLTGLVNNGGQIIQGIELDASGARIAYHLFTHHPGEAGGNVSQQTIRVPAEQILHIFSKDRPGQLRGVSAFAPVMLKMNDLAEYEEAELMRKKIESCFAAFVTQAGGINGASLAFGQQTVDSTRQETFRPGMIGYLNAGEDVKFGNPSVASGGDAFVRSMLRAIAVGLGITYEQLTGDLSNVNYSSMRGSLLEFRRMIEARRESIYIPMLCQKVWLRFLERGQLAGIFKVVKESDAAVKWSAPRFEQIDPYKDAMADLIMLRSGTLTLPDAIARLGNDPDKHLKTIAATNATLDALKIVVDSDPRNTTKTGILQALGGMNDTNPEPAASVS